MYELGQQVWWIEYDRSTTKTCTITIRSERFLTGRHSGNVVAVISPQGDTILLTDRPQMFAHPQDAIRYAYGAAVWMLLELAYDTVRIVEAGRLIRTIPEDIPRGKEESQPDRG